MLDLPKQQMLLALERQCRNSFCFLFLVFQRAVHPSRPEFGSYKVLMDVWRELAPDEAGKNQADHSVAQIAALN